NRLRSSYLASFELSRRALAIGCGTIRSSDFWRDSIVLTSGSHHLSPADIFGNPLFICSEFSCFLVGAEVRLTFSAAKIPFDDTINVTPPQGDPVSADFDLSSFR